MAGRENFSLTGGLLTLLLDADVPGAGSAYCASRFQEMDGALVSCLPSLNFSSPFCSTFIVLAHAISKFSAERSGRWNVSVRTRLGLYRSDCRFRSPFAGAGGHRPSAEHWACSCSRTHIRLLPLCLLPSAGAGRDLVRGMVERSDVFRCGVRFLRGRGGGRKARVTMRAVHAAFQLALDSHASLKLPDGTGWRGNFAVLSFRRDAARTRCVRL